MNIDQRIEEALARIYFHVEYKAEMRRGLMDWQFNYKYLGIFFIDTATENRITPSLYDSQFNLGIPEGYFGNVETYENERNKTI